MLAIFGSSADNHPQSLRVPLIWLTYAESALVIFSILAACPGSRTTSVPRAAWVSGLSRSIHAYLRFTLFITSFTNWVPALGTHFARSNGAPAFWLIANSRRAS